MRWQFHATASHYPHSHAYSYTHTNTNTASRIVELSLHAARTNHLVAFHQSAARTHRSCSRQRRLEQRLRRFFLLPASTPSP